MNEIPKEILERIFTFLTPLERFKVKGVCSKWYNYLKNEKITPIDAFLFKLNNFLEELYKKDPTTYGYNCCTAILQPPKYVPIKLQLDETNKTLVCVGRSGKVLEIAFKDFAGFKAKFTMHTGGSHFVLKADNEDVFKKWCRDFLAIKEKVTQVLHEQKLKQEQEPAQIKHLRQHLHQSLENKGFAK